MGSDACLRVVSRERVDFEALMSARLFILGFGRYEHEESSHELADLLQRSSQGLSCR
jgi:hypothetical protein